MIFTTVTLLSVLPPALILLFFSIKTIITYKRSGDTHGALVELAFVFAIVMVVLLAALQAAHVDASIRLLNESLGEVEGVLGGGR